MKKKAIKIAASTAVAASAFVAAAPANKADAAVNVDQLVKDAENAAGALKWAISVEGTADGQTAPHALYNLTKDANKAAQAAVAKTKGTDKVLYTARLQAVELQISRAMAYIDGITAGKKIAADTATLNAAIAAKDLTKVEAAYHQMTKEYRKQAALLDRVYGQSTRDVIRNATKKPAEAAIETVKVDVTVKMHLDAAAAATKAGDYKAAGVSYAKAQEWLDKVSATFKDQLTKSSNDVLAALPLQPVSVSRLNDTTVTVNFNKEIDAVAISHFAFDNSLSVTDVKLSENKKYVTLTTTEQAAGKTYTLSYKGEKTVYSFTKPAVNDDTVVVDSADEIYVDATVPAAATYSKGTRTITATFKNKDGKAFDGLVKVKTNNSDVKILSVNGTNLATADISDEVNVVPNSDGKITVKIASTAVAKDVVVTFEGNGKKEESGYTQFVEHKANTAIGATEAVEVVYVDKSKKLFAGKIGATEYWFTYDSNDNTYYNGSSVSADKFETDLAVGNKITVNYQNNGSNGYSDFNTTFVNTLKGLSITNPNRDTVTVAGDEFRVAANNQFTLKGKGHPGYVVYVYKNNAKLGTTTVDSNGNWSYTTNVNGLVEFGVKQAPSTQEEPVAIGKTAKIYSAAFGVAKVEGTGTTVSKIGVNAELDVTFTGFDTDGTAATLEVLDKGTFTTGSTLTFTDNQGVQATFTVGTTANDTKVKVTDPTTNGTNKVTLVLGQPKITANGGNNTFNFGAAVTLTGITGVKNQDGLTITLPNSISVE